MHLFWKKIIASSSQIKQALLPLRVHAHTATATNQYTSSTHWNPSPLPCLSDLRHNIYVEPTIIRIFSAVNTTILFFDLIASMLTHVPCHNSSNLSHFFFLVLSVYVLSSLLFLSCTTYTHINLSLSSMDFSLFWYKNSPYAHCILPSYSRTLS